MSKDHDDQYLLDWQPYLNDGKRKLSRYCFFFFVVVVFVFLFVSFLL